VSEAQVALLRAGGRHSRVGTAQRSRQRFERELPAGGRKQGQARPAQEHARPERFEKRIEAGRRQSAASGRQRNQRATAVAARLGR
jgi:hypothetical protein